MVDIQNFEQFSRMLIQISRELTRIKSKHMSKYGLGSTHVMCILSLGRKNAQTAGELVCGEDIDKAQMSRVLSELCKKDFIRPVTGQNCKYKKKYELTEAGKEVFIEIEDMTRKIVEFVDKDIDFKDIATMYRTMNKIYENLIKAGELF